MVEDEEGSILIDEEDGVGLVGGIIIDDDLELELLAGAIEDEEAMLFCIDMDDEAVLTGVIIAIGLDGVDVAVGEDGCATPTRRAAQTSIFDVMAPTLTLG